MNQINKTNQITRQTGLVPDVQTGKVPVCSESFSQPVPPPVRPQRPAPAGSAPARAFWNSDTPQTAAVPDPGPSSHTHRRQAIWPNPRLGESSYLNYRSAPSPFDEAGAQV